MARPWQLAEEPDPLAEPEPGGARVRAPHAARPSPTSSSRSAGPVGARARRRPASPSAGSLTGSRLPTNRIGGWRPAPPPPPPRRPAGTPPGPRPAARASAGAPGPTRQHRLPASRRPGGHEVGAPQRRWPVHRPPRPSAAPYPMSGGRQLAAHERDHHRPSEEPAGDAWRPHPPRRAHRPWTRSIGRRRWMATTARTPRASTRARPPPPRPRRAPSARTRAPATRTAGRAGGWRSATTSTVVDGGQPLDEVDDGRHPRLVALDRRSPGRRSRRGGGFARRRQAPRGSRPGATIGVPASTLDPPRTACRRGRASDGQRGTDRLGDVSATTNSSPAANTLA